MIFPELMCVAVVASERTRGRNSKERRVAPAFFSFQDSVLGLWLTVFLGIVFAHSVACLGNSSEKLIIFFYYHPVLVAYEKLLSLLYMPSLTVLYQARDPTSLPSLEHPKFRDVPDWTFPRGRLWQH